LPSASTGWRGSFIGVPSRLLISQPHGSPPTCLKCSPVKMPSTPGALAAAAVSSLLMRACACGLRRKWPQVWPGSVMSSV
jgi:hypothetical protein